jgi:hypothetical protein
LLRRNSNVFFLASSWASRSLIVVPVTMIISACVFTRAFGPTGPRRLHGNEAGLGGVLRQLAYVRVAARGRKPKNRTRTLPHRPTGTRRDQGDEGTRAHLRVASQPTAQMPDLDGK